MRLASCLLLSIAASVGMAQAQAQAQTPESDRKGSLFEGTEITGSVRAGYWSSTRTLDDESHLGAGMFWIKAGRPASGSLRFFADGWLALRGPRGDADATGEAREAFLDLRLGQLDVRAGRQIIAWGRADGVNPTDNLTGEDLTLLTPDEDDRRLGATAVRATYFLGDVSITALWVPEFRPHRLALPAPPQDSTFSERSRRWPADQWAARLEQTGGAIDWSLSYFRGLDLTPDLSFQAASEGPGVIRLAHHRVEVLGGDMTLNAGRYGLRAEGAYVDTEDPSGDDPSVKNPFVFLVVGGDRTFREHLNLNLQYLYRFVLNHHPLNADASPPAAAVVIQQSILSGQAKRTQHGASLRIAYKWFHETLEAECAAAGYVEPTGFTLRPKLVYAVSDRWKLSVGAEFFRGEDRALFGLLRANSTVYVEARWNF